VKEAAMLSVSQYHPEPSAKVRLRDYDPQDAGGLDKEQASAQTDALQRAMFELQRRLYAENKQSLLIVLQALDTGGKDGTIRKVFEGINPQGVRVVSFKAPTEIERAHDFLWRVHVHTPPTGMIAIFNRSHYEDVLVPRVMGYASDEVIEARYEAINAFERNLAYAGTRILKFYLNISREEQKERLTERLGDPDKHWKFQRSDLETRARWDEYIAAYEAMLRHCNTAYAPWYVVPANRKWYRDYVVTQVIVDALKDMDPQYPASVDDFSDVVIPD
jgi:PPK2 family polyphosphate:nucleotide phosphotransferase